MSNMLNDGKCYGEDQAGNRCACCEKWPEGLWLSLNTRATQALWAREHHSLVCILNASLWVPYRYWTKERQGKELRADTATIQRREVGGWNQVGAVEVVKGSYSRCYLNMEPSRFADVGWEREKPRIMPCFVYFKWVNLMAWYETPVLWPPHVKSWLIGKDSDAGRDWGQEEKGPTEDEITGWHHWLDGRESECTPGVGDGQGGLTCCDLWGCKVLDMTEWLNWTEVSHNFSSK